MQKLLQTNDQFNQIIQELYLLGSIHRHDHRLLHLSTEAKYYLIRMKSHQFLSFDNRKISVSDSGAAYLLQTLSENRQIRLSA